MLLSFVSIALYLILNIVIEKTREISFSAWVRERRIRFASIYRDERAWGALFARLKYDREIDIKHVEV